MGAITSTISSLKAKFGKKIMIVETAYPFTTQNADGYPNIIGGDAMVSGYPITPEGQYQYLANLTQAVIAGGGTGVMYWEPAWITSNLHDPWGTGSSWENNAFFDFSGNAISGMEYMTYSYQF